MPGPNWDDEDNNMHPTCEGASGALTPQQNAFINQIKNKATLTTEESNEMREIWFEVTQEQGEG